LDIVGPGRLVSLGVGAREAFLAAHDTNDTKNLPGDARAKQQIDKTCGCSLIVGAEAV
jgi:hypothetical protein